MKIYHKFLLYQNKLLKPYVRILLGLVEALTYLASLLLIVGVIYEHGFPLSVDEVAKIQVLYKAVWIIFLVDVTLHISLEYRSTKKQYRRLAWILSGLLYLTLIPVIFHRPEEEGAILQFWEFLDGKFYHLVLLLIFSFLNLSNGLVCIDIDRIDRKFYPAIFHCRPIDRNCIKTGNLGYFFRT